MVDLEGDRLLCSAMMPEVLFLNLLANEVVSLTNKTDCSNWETGINDFFKSTSLRLSATMLSNIFMFFIDGYWNPLKKDVLFRMRRYLPSSINVSRLFFAFPESNDSLANSIPC